MSFPKIGYQASAEWAGYFRRRDEAQRTGRSLTDLRLDYVERMQAKGQQPVSFIKWLPLRDEL